MQRAPPSVRGQQSRRSLNNAKRAVMARAGRESGQGPSHPQRRTARGISTSTQHDWYAGSEADGPRLLNHAKRYEGARAEVGRRSTDLQRVPPHSHLHTASTSTVHNRLAGSEDADSSGTHLASHTERKDERIGFHRRPRHLLPQYASTSTHPHDPYTGSKAGERGPHNDARG
jgi:hypothetical protein